MQPRRSNWLAGMPSTIRGGAVGDSRAVPAWHAAQLTPTRAIGVLPAAGADGALLPTLVEEGELLPALAPALREQVFRTPVGRTSQIRVDAGLVPRPVVVVEPPGDVSGT